MAWNLKTQLIESCSCKMMCPCWFGVPELMSMDEGWCATAFVWRVLEGASDGVGLGGTTVAMVTHFPGPTLFDGNGTMRLYVHEGASPEQQRELEAIFQGKKGGPMEILAGLATTWLPTKRSKIEFHDDGDTLTVTVGEDGEVKSNGLKDQEGRPMTMQNAGFASVLQMHDRTVELAPSNTQWSDPDMPQPFTTSSGARAVCSWSVS